MNLQPELLWQEEIFLDPVPVHQKKNYSGDNLGILGFRGKFVCRHMPCPYCFVHPIFPFWFLVAFGDEGTKIQKYYEIFVYILQGKLGKTGKNWKENQATKVTKIPKPKVQNMG